jgi:2,4-dienoyl-CoA reductase-like NADH-dependent reductase (Old Yellow Enzyme family)/thioredoxin reductase
MEPFPHLFSPIKIGKLEIANRICMLPMTTGYSEADDSVGDRMISFFAERAKSGPGIMFAPFAPVDAGSPVEPGIYHDRFIAGASRLTRSIHSFGPRILAQLIISYHIKFNETAEVVGPSAVWNGIMRCNPRPLTAEEIGWITGEYGEAARRSREAGFDGVELMAGGGYLLNRFISPFGNNREDGYVGSPEKRMRILLEIIESIRSRAGRDFPISCRLNCDDQMKGGLTIEDCEYIAGSLERAGAVAITVYTGWHESPAPTVQAMLPKAAFIHLAEKLKSWVKIPVIASNRINDPFIAEKIIAEGKADMVGMARALLADPEFPKKAREGRASEIVPCMACSECIADAVSGYKDWGKPISVSCSINPAAGHEGEKGGEPAAVSKKVWVIGGGPGGMEAAIQASLRGHNVTLFEKGPRIGGKLLLGCVPPHKEAVKDLIGSLKARAGKAGVEIKLNSSVTPESLVKTEKPDVLIVAIGADPIMPPIPGLMSSNVMLVEDILSGKASVGCDVLIIGGGMVGCETAEYLVMNEKDLKTVTVLEMLDRMADNVSPTYRPFFLARLKKQGIKLMTGAKVTEITPQGVSVEQNGTTKFLEGSAVILAAGYKENKARNESFLGRAPEVHFIGDCVKARMIREAVREGYQLGRKI